MLEIRTTKAHLKVSPVVFSGALTHPHTHTPTHPHTHTQHTHNLFQVEKKKKKKVLFVAPANRARVNVHRKRLRKGGPVIHDHNGKRYKGTVVEKEGDGQVLLAYPDYPGYYQEYKGEDTVLYVKSI